LTAIAGIWLTDGKDPEPDIARMLDALHVFGRDGRTHWSDGAVAIGRALTRLTPEDKFDLQIAEASRRYAVVADTRVDDRTELGRDVGLSSAELEVTCDATLLALAIERWGFDHLHERAGPFAIAAWDRLERKLILARDPFGLRPLFFHRGKGVVAFASTMAALHALPYIERAPDTETVGEFLAGLPLTTTRTYYAKIERVLPGCYCVLGVESLSDHRYWNPTTGTLRLANHQEYVEGLRYHLDVAVSSQLRRSRGQGGVMLSGGLDSAAVASSAAVRMPPGDRLLAFTSVPRGGFDAPQTKGWFFDEGPRAAATAALYENIDHILVYPQDRPLVDLDEMFGIYQEPLRNLFNSGWIHDIYEQARQRGVSVLMTGTLGNTTISYGGGALLGELVQGGRWGAWWRTATRVVQRRTMNWGGVLMNSFGAWLPPAVWQAGERLGGRAALEPSRWSPLKPSVWKSTTDAAFSREEYFDVFGRPSLSRPLEMGGDSGALDKAVLGYWGIDCRDPTADQRLAKFCFSIPNEHFLFDGEAKALIKHALAGRAAAVAVSDNRKGYQAPDWYERLSLARQQLLDEIECIDEFSVSSSLIDTERLRSLVENGPSEGWQSDARRADYRAALLQGVSAAHFLRRASGRNR
jgi:asparagine synthase (glutamine-hydrolysing)